MCFSQQAAEVGERQISGLGVLCLLVCCALLNGVELFLDISLQAEQEMKKARVDDQNSATDVTRSSSPPQVCGDGQASSMPFSMM